MAAALSDVRSLYKIEKSFWSLVYHGKRGSQTGRKKERAVRDKSRQRVRQEQIGQAQIGQEQVRQMWIRKMLTRESA